MSARFSFASQVKVVTTNSAKHFFNESEVKAEAELYTDADEYAMWQKRGDNVLHIEVREGTIYNYYSDVK